MMYYGFPYKGLKPSKYTPDYGQCRKEEIKNWEKDLEKEKNGAKDFSYHWGIGIIED